MKDSLEDLKEKVRDLDILVGSVKPDHVVILELLEELGELSHAIICEMGHKKHKPQRDVFNEELGDVLYLVLRLAYLRDIDLDKQLDFTMSKIKKYNKGKKGDVALV